MIDVVAVVHVELGQGAAQPVGKASRSAQRQRRLWWKPS
jgi:hypothetical protein